MQGAYSTVITELILCFQLCDIIDKDFSSILFLTPCIFYWCYFI